MPSPAPRKKVIKIATDPQSCGSCRFVLKNPKDEMGYCRRYPPAMLFDEEGELAVSYPTVEVSDWCGEYSRKTH